MRMWFIAVAAAFCVTGTAMGQVQGNGPPPSAIGNHANGFDYQPTPGEIVPREKAAGIRPPAAQQRATDQELEQLDKDLLREEGLSTKSVPKIMPGQ
jgi:hypothetical protein